MALGPTVIRGNASEIMALASLGGERTRGVDSSHPSEAAAPMARALAARQGCIVAVSGAVDVVTDGTRTLLVENGHPLLQKVTATGCSVTALIAAFVAVAGPEQALEATAHALAYFGCGEGIWVLVCSCHAVPPRRHRGRGRLPLDL